MVQQTSLQAFVSIKNCLGERQLQVLNAFGNDECLTNKELSQRLRLAINQVTPRVLELRKRGLVVYAGVKEDVQSRKTSMMWKKQKEELIWLIQQTQQKANT